MLKTILERFPSNPQIYPAISLRHNDLLVVLHDIDIPFDGEPGELPRFAWIFVFLNWSSLEMTPFSRKIIKGTILMEILDVFGSFKYFLLYFLMASHLFLKICRCCFQWLARETRGFFTACSTNLVMKLSELSCLENMTWRWCLIHTF